MVTRLFTRVLEVLLLAVIFTFSMTLTSLTCSVTNRQIIESTYQECITVLGIPDNIYKMEKNRITFSDGDFDNVKFMASVVAEVPGYPVRK